MCYKPMKPQNRDILLHFRVSKTENDQLKKEAYEQGMKLSDYIRSRLFRSRTIPHATALSVSPAKVLPSDEYTTVPVVDELM